MYVVKRPFRNYGIVYTAGSVITDPAVIKRFKGRVAEGKIIEVTEQTFEATAQYFKAKYGVDLNFVDTSKPKVDEPVAKPAVAKAKAVAKK